MADNDIYDPFGTRTQITDPMDNFAIAQAVAQHFLDESTTFEGALRNTARDLLSAGLGVSVDISTPTPPPLAPPATIDVGDYLYTPDYGDKLELRERTFEVPPEDFIKPEKEYGSAPDVLPGFDTPAPEMTDTIQTFAPPPEPTITIPGYPDFTAINFPAQFNDDAPEYTPSDFEFSIAPPNIVPYVDEDSGIVADVRARRDWLIARIEEGGTGLPTAVEQGVWDRAREREMFVALNAEQDAATQDAAMGFPIPGGALQAKLAKVRMDYAGKIITANREIAIKQAELEIDNINKALGFLSELEGRLITADIEQKKINLEAAKYQLTAAVQIFEAQIKAHMATLDAKKIGVQVYQAMMEGYTARVTAYRTLVDAEKSKIEFNKGVIDMYNAQIGAEMGKVQLYKARVDALTALSALEEFKIRKFESEIRAYSAEVSAYTARVGGKSAEVQAWAERIKAYSTDVQAYSTEIDAYSKKYQYTIEAYKALLQTDSLKTEIYKTNVEAESTKAQVGVSFAKAHVDAQSAYAQAMSAYNNVLSNQWNATAQHYIAAENVAVNVAKINTDTQQTYRSMSNDMAKVSAQVYSQLSGAAMGMAHASSSQSTSGSMGQSVGVHYNYNQTIR